MQPLKRRPNENLDALDQAQKKTAEIVLKKWTADTHLIAAILTELEQKLASADLRLAFQDAGAQDRAIAVGHITGVFSGKPVDLTLIVRPTGEIDPIEAGPKAAHLQMQFALPARISVLSAHKGEYEALILRPSRRRLRHSDPSADPIWDPNTSELNVTA